MFQDTLFTGKQCFVLDSVDSTNNYAAKLIQNGLAHNGALVKANFQSHGRGQRDRQWQSNPGENMLLSYIFFPKNLNIKRQFSVNAAFALAVCKQLQEVYQLRAEIKWPNDIIVNHKKIAGLLIETSIKGSQIVSIIAGIGLNVNQAEFDDSFRATSISIEKNQSINLDDCLSALNSWVEAYYLKIMNEKFDEVLEQYNYVLYGRNTKKLFETPKGITSYSIIGLMHDGKLEVRDAQQLHQALEFGKNRMILGS